MGYRARMENSSRQIAGSQLVRYSKPAGTNRCLACGTDRIKPGRRYCSKECRQQINWVLSLSKGLLRAFNARYAAFSFTPEHVVLDVLPVWSQELSRFTQRRSNGNKPAQDLKRLILRWGEEWHHMVGNNNSRSYASLSLLRKNHCGEVDADTIKPGRKARLRLTRHEKECLKILRIERTDLMKGPQSVRIKSAYKRMAKVYHPDMGGDAEKFKRLNEAHRQMLLWAENPRYTSRRALRDCWSYDGATNRWSPPL